MATIKNVVWVAVVALTGDGRISESSISDGVPVGDVPDLTHNAHLMGREVVFGRYDSVHDLAAYAFLST